MQISASGAAVVSDAMLCSPAFAVAEEASVATASVTEAWQRSAGIGALDQPMYQSSDCSVVRPLTFGHVEWNDRTSYGYDSLELSWHPEALRNGAGLAPDYGRCHHTGNYFIDNGDDRVKGIENSGVSLCRKEFVEYRTSPAKPNVSGLRFAVSLNDARLIETGVKFPTRTAPRLQGALRVGSVRANTEYCERYFWITAREAMTSKFPPFTVPPECAKSASVSIGNIESFRIGFSYGA